MLVGGWLVVVGVQGWFDQRAAMAVVHGFLDAVEKGDRDRALALLEAGRREDLATELQDPRSPVWVPTPGVKHRINEMEVDGDSARAKVWIEKNGFLLEPVVHLRRVDTGSWKIVSIEQLTVDPKWKDLVQQREKLADEETNRELQDALKRRPGATVSRAPLHGNEQVGRPQ